MGCNTSKETALQPAEEEKDKNENDPTTNKIEENNVNEAKEQNEAKPPSARTITIKSASNSKPNSPTPAGTKEGTETGADLVADNDLTDPDLADAATKIQAVFRGHQTRRTMKQDDKSTKPKSAHQQQQQQQQLQGQQQMEDEFSSDDVELTHAATKIQASFRGHMVRKQMGTDDVKEKPHDPTPAEEELDIDLTDPELNKAATKIQASFRGHAVRKETQPGQGESAK